MAYLRNAYNKNATPQSEPIPGSTQVANSAGGYSWKIDDWKRLDRFLILGSSGGTYYIGEKALTRENAEAVERCIEADGPKTVNRIVEISVAGRAPKNDPALFALAMCAGLGDEKTRRAALEALPEVARIGTHLFHFASYVEGFRGWGRGLRNAIGDWYQQKEANKVAYQAVKYQQRDGWSHADLLRLTHPKPIDDEHKKIYKYIVDGEILDGVSKWVTVFEQAQKTKDEKEIIKLIRDNRLEWEMIPNEFHNSPAVWEAILPNLGSTAVIRNLGNMSKCGFLVKGDWNGINAVTAKIADKELMKKARVHPIAILAASLTYGSGHSVKGSGEWKVVPNITDALDAAFYAAFGNVEPANKPEVLALDISGSMSGGEVAGVPNLTPRLASAALAMVTYKTEPMTTLLAFQTNIVELDISKCSRLKEVEKVISNLPMGGTDCAQPMLWALQKKVKSNAFIVYTDSETWAGHVHPSQALSLYRKTINIPAKLIVVGMTSNGFSIADPDDAGMLDIVGFDTAVPEVMSQFIKD